MSQAHIEKILKEVQEVLKKNIRNELDLAETIATFTPKIVSKAILDQLKFTYADNRKKFPAFYALNNAQKISLIRTIIKKVGNAMESLHKSFKNQHEYLKNQGVLIIVNPNNFDINTKSFTVTAITTDKSKLKSVWRGRGNLVEVGSFQSIKEGYRDIINYIWQELKIYLENIVELSEEDKKGFKQGAADLEHDLSNSVSARQIKAGADILLKELEAIGSTTSAHSIAKALELETFLEYAATEISTNVKVFIGSRSKNRSQATLEKQKLEEMQNKLESALKNYSIAMKNLIVSDWKGSDSRLDIEKKKVIRAIKKGLKKHKNIKFTTKIDTNLKLSNKKSKKASIKGKVSKNKISVNNLRADVKSKIIVTKKKKESTLNLGALKAQINAKLPMTVIKNMGTPALENRTGRFARSAQVTDVIQTSKGFPSIGYTYQKYPYQTFEPGFKQGSAERDPRVVIDRSIREIAQQLIVGRFYTRRV